MKFYNKKGDNDNLDEQKDSKQTYEMSPNKRKKIILIVGIAACFLIVGLILCTAFALFNINNTRMIKGISIKGIEISGLTKEQAESKINQIIEEKLDKDIFFKADNFEYSIKLKQIETKYDIKKAVQEAYDIGRKGNIFFNNFDIIKTSIKGENIDLEYAYNEKLLDDTIADIAGKIPDAVIEPSYYIEDDILIITRGKEGNSIDKDKTKNKILEIIYNDNADLNIKIDIKEAKPSEIDIDKIHEEIYKEPKNAYYKKDPFEIFPQENGVDFDINEAKKLLEEVKDEYEIKLKITIPEITTAELGTEAFPDLLSTFSTKYDASNKSRTNNLILAMNKINGMIIKPGETFSYNKTLGKRTVAAGYKEAGGFAGGRVVQMLGGGICQISSTLYNAVVYANLEVVERHNHMFIAGYVGAGKDATVSYGTLDFKFKNTRKYPIMIKTTIGGGVAKVSIFGIKEDVEYEVEISANVLSYIPFSVVYENNSSLAEGQEKVVQNGMNGCKSVTYKIKKLNGKQVTSEVLSTDTYDALNKIIQKGVKSIPVETQTGTVPQMEAPVETTSTVPVQETVVKPEPIPEKETTPETETIPETETPQEQKENTDNLEQN